MPEVHYHTVVPVPRAKLWAFVKNIDNWAPMMTGYQSHEILDERRSRWVLRGDVGILSRSVKLDVTITEWAGPERVSFTLVGVNEAVSGGGSFELSEEGGGPTPAPIAKEMGWFRRLLSWFGRTMFRWQHGATEAPKPVEAGGTGLTFTWMMEASGPTAPLVNVMLEPALQPAAEALAHKIAAHLVAKA